MYSLRKLRRWRIILLLYFLTEIAQMRGMDYVSHGLWSYIFFHRIRTPLFAVVFGLLPDTLSWFIYLIYRLLTGGAFGKPVLAEIPDWAFTLYHISHSLVVAFLCILLISLILRRVLAYLFAWPIAIVMDLLTHTREFLPTPFLWPISDWTFPGISWGTKWFMIVNYILIMIAMMLIWIFHRKKRLSKTRLPAVRAQGDGDHLKGAQDDDGTI